MQLFTSAVTETEILVGPLRAGDAHALAAARALFASSSVLAVVDVDRDVALASATIRARHDLKLPDAIVAGTAQALACTLLVGNDTVFRRLDDIEYLHLDDLA